MENFVRFCEKMSGNPFEWLGRSGCSSPLESPGI